MPLLEGAVRVESAQARAAQCVTCLGLETHENGRRGGISRQGFKCTDHGALPQSICSKATTLVMGVKRDSVLYVFFAMCSGSGSVSTETPDIALFARP